MGCQNHLIQSYIIMIDLHSTIQIVYLFNRVSMGKWNFGKFHEKQLMSLLLKINFTLLVASSQEVGNDGWEPWKCCPCLQHVHCCLSATEVETAQLTSGQDSPRTWSCTSHDETALTSSEKYHVTCHGFMQIIHV